MTIEQIKAKLAVLKEQDTEIHISLHFQSPKMVLEEAPAKIKGLYPFIFSVEENTTGRKQSHSLQYTDIAVGRVLIKELK